VRDTAHCDHPPASFAQIWKQKLSVAKNVLKKTKK
jgi:hypothetical protein